MPRFESCWPRAGPISACWRPKRWSSFPSEETYAALLKASRRETERVRLSALRSAIELGQAPPVGEMLDAVIGGSERASLLFSDLLQRATRTQIDGAIAALARSDLTRPVRIMVLQALGASGDERALSPLCAAVRSPDAEIRAGALGALSLLGHPGAAEVVTDGIVDPDWRVRLKAIECVRRLGLTDFFARGGWPAPTTRSGGCATRAGQTLMSLAEQDVAKLKSFARSAAQQSREFAALMHAACAAGRGQAGRVMFEDYLSHLTVGIASVFALS
ncbi:MAG: HEAT repeat domain-containing protein [Caulobacteraceae bacterium]